ncbi:MAG: hypothetical protein QOH58_1434 [Thermoleophilaceae bacterium]|nr:hypothetical protein [Thermoleophilaceae bacterium]
MALTAALALAGCGGDDESEPAATTEAPPAPTVTEAETAPEAEPTVPQEQTETLPPDGDGTGAGTGENGPGGAGDEEPARTLALFTGENGRIEPSVVRVPAFISIRVELRSADGREYGLAFDGEAIAVGGELGSVSTTIDGLRPGARVIGKPTGASNEVRIEATAEPGP